MRNKSASNCSITFVYSFRFLLNRSTPTNQFVVIIRLVSECLFICHRNGQTMANNINLLWAETRRWCYHFSSRLILSSSVLAFWNMLFIISLGHRFVSLVWSLLSKTILAHAFHSLRIILSNQMRNPILECWKMYARWSNDSHSLTRLSLFLTLVDLSLISTVPHDLFAITIYSI